MASKHEIIERNVFLMIVCTLLTVAVGGLIEIVPLFFQKTTMTAIDQQGNALNIKPYDPLRLSGRDIYVREGCYLCHSQMIRPFRSETERYGHYSLAGEYIYDHPFQWGSRRTGPDLARVGGRYSDEWHRAHLLDPRSVVPESNMPAYTWLRRPLKTTDIQAKMRALNKVGHHKYSDAEISAAPGQLEGKTELDAVVAYLQGMGLALQNAQNIR